MKKKVLRFVIPGGNDPHIFELMNHFKEEAIFFEVVDQTDLCEKYQLENMRYHQVDTVEEVLSLAIQMVANNEVDGIIKGIVQTHQLLKEVLKKEYQLVEHGFLSHVSRVNMMDTGQTFLLTDAAININPDIKTMQQIVQNALLVARKIGMTYPKVALLSSAENYNPKMPSSVLAKSLMDYYQSHPSEVGQGVVYGPLSLDLALSKTSVQNKRFKGPIAGDANILVVPSIDVGNVLYKSLSLFSNAKIGGIVVGAKVPIVLSSRGDSVENKISSIQLALEYGGGLNVTSISD